MSKTLHPDQKLARTVNWLLNTHHKRGRRGANCRSACTLKHPAELMLQDGSCHLLQGRTRGDGLQVIEQVLQQGLQFGGCGIRL